MKMKRMEMRDVSIGEYQFKIRPFGAKDALYIFGDVASILLPILGSVAVASDDKDAVEMEKECPRFPVQTGEESAFGQSKA